MPNPIRLPVFIGVSRVQIGAQQPFDVSVTPTRGHFMDPSRQPLFAHQDQLLCASLFDSVLTMHSPPTAAESPTKKIHSVVSIRISDPRPRNHPHCEKGKTELGRMNPSVRLQYASIREHKAVMVDVDGT
ncbi:unnamed protein product [Protopolystoma xenopodis]|uniref:Uncharacterized protein n=1 Tax=Protopolystoma xenopodis TaxID=117903 RepID=A0A448XDB8_9PLAT|nr:unnamed protein product [Protopolystoma xenopodis]